MPRERTKKGVPIEGTFAEVLRAYEQSGEFPRHPGTASNYRRAIRWAEAVLGRYPRLDTVNGIRPKLVQAALDELYDTPAERVNRHGVLVTIDKWAAPREWLMRSITFGVKVKIPEGGHEPWTDAQVELALKHARPDLARVIMLAVHTGQRGSDIAKMRLTDISQERHPITGELHTGVHVVQKKTGLRLWVPFTLELAAAVETWRRDIRPPWLLVTQPNGQPYQQGDLSDAWRAERERNEALAPLNEAGLVLHGLRATCVVRLRKGGASPLQIANMVGMSEPMVARYSRLADQLDMALAAVHYLNARTARERNRPENEPKVAQVIDKSQG